MTEKTFHPTPRYLRRLENYLEWEKCTTPMDGLPAGITNDERPIVAYTNPVEAIFRMETFGEKVTCPDPMFRRYIRGKANRDWWTKEKGWWDREACYIPEEFLCHLLPLNFIELFDRSPRTHQVRYWFDNDYTNEQFEKDLDRFYKYGLEVEQEGMRLTNYGPTIVHLADAILPAGCAAAKET